MKILNSVKKSGKKFVKLCLHYFIFITVREDEIDRMICRLQEQGYNTVTKLAVKGFNYISNMVMQTAIRVSLEHLFWLLDILYFYIIDICLSTSISEIWDFFFHLSDLHAFFTSKAPELMTDFVIEAQRLQQSAAQNNTTQSSIDTTDHPEPRFVNFFILLFWVCFASNIYYKGGGDGNWGI